PSRGPPVQDFRIGAPPLNRAGRLFTSASVRPLLPLLLPLSGSEHVGSAIRAQKLEATTGIEPVYAVLQGAPLRSLTSVDASVALEIPVARFVSAGSDRPCCCRRCCRRIVTC